MALAMLAPQISTAEGKDMTQDQQDVLAAVQNMTGSFQDGDIAEVMASYESQATVVFEPDAPVSDATQLEQIFTGMAAVNPVFDYEAGHEVIVNGDIAVHIAPWTMTGLTPDGQELAQSGLSVAVLRKQADGSWKLVIDNPHGGRLLAQGQ
ncbi:MAG: YybH family protein [Thalassospira sp.]|uniref:YybH family protein n=1 Tax=Thalassospira sp. TaxID=1912094 RepID=UPI003A84EB47